jgi:hypothetical protein
MFACEAMWIEDSQARQINQEIRKEKDHFHLRATAGRPKKLTHCNLFVICYAVQRTCFRPRLGFFPRQTMITKVQSKLTRRTASIIMRALQSTSRTLPPVCTSLKFEQNITFLAPSPCLSSPKPMQSPLSQPETVAYQPVSHPYPHPGRTHTRT